MLAAAEVVRRVEAYRREQLPLTVAGSGAFNVRAPGPRSGAPRTPAASSKADATLSST